jgi:hypothetical protein
MHAPIAEAASAEYTGCTEICMTPEDAFASLNRMAGLAPLKTPVFSGSDPVIPTPFRAATAAAAALGFAASAAHDIWRLRGGEAQDIAIDLKLAAASLASFGIQRLDGNALPRPGATNPAIAFYCGGDGRWIHLHGGFPHLAARTLDLLNANGDAQSIAEAVAKWNAFALEDALAHLGLCGVVARTAEEWRSCPQGAALEKTPPIALTRIGDAPPLRLEKGDEPLDGIRVLDLTRVLAGPTCGRTLASHGADVLNVCAERLDTIEAFDLDTGHGKRLAFLDLVKPADAETLRKLVRGAHVFVDSYRPGALAQLGFTPAALAHAAPGIVHVGVSAYGAYGPWGQRRGWEQLAQTATGVAMEQGAFVAARRRDTQPALIPAAACDYITGYLAAAGAAAALLRRIREGGSWKVEVSLAATAQWLQSLGRVDAAAVPDGWLGEAGLDGHMKSCETKRGRLDFLGPVVRMSKTEPRWLRPPPEPGPAVWLYE